MSITQSMLVRNKDVTIKAEEESSLSAKFCKFGKPSIRLFLGDAFASDNKRRHDAQQALAVGMLVVFRIEHRDHITMPDRKTSVAKLS